VKHKSFYVWFIWILGTLFYMFQFVLRASPNAMAKDFMEAFAIQATSLGVLASCYYYPYATLQIPLGVLLDRIGPARVMRWAIIICVAGVFSLSVAPTFFVACMGRVLIGIGASGAFLSTLAWARHWLPASRVALAVGLTFAAGKFGGFMSGPPLTFLVQTFDWRVALMVLGGIGGLIALLLWIFLDVGRKKTQEADKERSSSHVLENLLVLLKTKRMWIIAFYGCMMFVPISAFTDMWTTLFMMKKHGIPKAVASWGTGFVFAGTVVGGPLIALLSNRLGSRRIPMRASALISLLLSLCLVFVSYDNLYISYTLLLLLGLCMTGQSLTFTCAAEAMPSSMGGVATGLANTLIMMGGALFQPLVGFVLDLLWDGSYSSAGVRSYALGSFTWAMALWPLAMGTGLVLSFFLPETHPKKRTINVGEG